jgi:hypothetical protein
MGAANWDIPFFKATSIGEKLNVQFGTEIFNVFNRTQLGIPNATCCSVNLGATTATNANFGVISTLLNSPRQVQFALKISY